MTIWDEMSDAERKESLRHLGPQGVWAADALDAQAARIKELEGALRVAIKHWEGWCDQNNGSMPDNVMGGEADDYARALEALK